jgi:hypothetical protein
MKKRRAWSFSFAKEAFTTRLKRRRGGVDSVAPRKGGEKDGENESFSE